MGKRIYITEDIANELSEMVKPSSELPNDIKNALRGHKTSLGVHPSFPPEEEVSFDMLVTQSRFEEVIAKINTVNIDSYHPRDIEKHLRKLIDKCKEIELNFKQKLENICYNYVIDLFKVPDGLVAFDCKLVEVVDSDKAPVQDTETIEFDNIKQRSRLHDAVYKRRIINAIITGGALRLSWIDKQLIGEIYELSPELPSIYRDIIILNDYLLFTKNNTGISETNKKQSGISYLTIGNDTTKNKVSVEAEIFPVLLYESIRGFLEMFAAYGLPASKRECAYVMSKADFINAEPWDMRMGPELWDYIMDIFNNPETENIPLLLTTLFSQRTEKFNAILQEIFGETKNAKTIADKIWAKVQIVLETDDFDEMMAKKQTDVSIIADDYFLPEEL
jgi:hypothetical protein